MTIKEIFDTMDYGPAPESASEALAWLVDQGSRFGQFIDGAFTPPTDDFETKNPANGSVLATLSQATEDDIAAAHTAAKRAQGAWAKDAHARARVLYALARLVQKNARLFAVLETLDNGKPIRESRDIDIPLVARHFYYHAGMAQLMDAELPDRAPLGVCGQIIPWNFPLLMLAWKVAPALAMGNTVVLKPAEYTSLTALLFADICRQAGVPKGVVNILTGDGAVGEKLTARDFDKIAFTGSTAVGRAIRKATAGRAIPLTLELGGKSPYIVFDDADIDSAIEGLVDAIWFNQGQVCCAGSRLLVQEGIAEPFYTKLRARMGTLRIGDPLDKSIDIGAVVDPVQLQTIKSLVDANVEGETYHAPGPLPAEGCYYPPTLITGLSTASPLMQEEIFGPVLVGTTFRTPAEAVQIANNTRYGLAATLWTENVNLALDVAPKLAAGVVWVNATNLFDAAAGFGGVRESGFGREGGWEGLLAYTKPKAAGKAAKTITPHAGDGAPGAGIDRTPKLYIGGKQARPDGGYSRAVYGPRGALLGQAPEANRKDIRNAVEVAAASPWRKTTGHGRAQVLFFMAENLAARAEDLSRLIDAPTGKRGGAAEVEASVQALFTAAAWADKLDGAAKPVPLRGVALAMREAVGSVGLIAPDALPLLGLVAPAAAALAMGNSVVALASHPYPLAALEFVQVLETSDLPAGALNILTGEPEALSKTLAEHLALDALWSFAPRGLAQGIEAASAGNLKRTWISETNRAWDARDIREALEHATEVKTIWVPYGEG
ncbi:MAG: aldehyde dehydrogenase family protein [Pseudomonadota bacterium]